MCGIAGFVDGRHGGPPDRLIALAEAMNETLRHRGPDDGGVWTDAETGVALANRRLAVRDLSSAGHQPMVSDDGRLVLTYNGEIYDTRDLRASLEATGRRFRGGSDTEVLLQACAEWGLREPSADATACSPSPFGTVSNAASPWPATAWASSRSTGSGRTAFSSSRPSSRPWSIIRAGRPRSTATPWPPSPGSPTCRHPCASGKGPESWNRAPCLPWRPAGRPPSRATGTWGTSPGRDATSPI